MFDGLNQYLLNFSNIINSLSVNFNADLCSTKQLRSNSHNLASNKHNKSCASAARGHGFCVL